jgi:DNA-directed RNA polymerase subunit M/transcription elongation factor TFIIS
MEPQTLVWIKIEGYPWWPAIVADHVASEVALPEGKDTLVQFLGSGDAGFVSSSLTEEVVLFRGEEDADKISESAADSGCEQAVHEALALWQAALSDAAALQAEGAADGGSSSSEAEAATENSDRKKEKKEKKNKKDKKIKKDKRDKKEKRRRERADSDEDERDDVQEKERARRKQAQRDMRHREAADSGDVMITSRKDARQHAIQTTKRIATQKELCDLRDKLEIAVEEHSQPAARAILSDLARISVNYSQLKTTRIGVTVGQLLAKEFPYCHPLATAILKYWFSQLPTTQQRRLTAQEEVELASDASQEGSGRGREDDMAQLHAFGVQLERCFMVEEQQLLIAEEREGASTAVSPVAAGSAVETTFGETPSSTSPTPGTTLIPASKIARVLEECVAKHPDVVRHFLLNYLNNSDHTTIRTELLTGVTTPEACVELVASMCNARGNAAVPADVEVIKGSDATVEDEYDNVSHLFPCPSCGVASASTSERMTGMHGEDHILVTWATCTKCHHGWTV